MIQRVNELFDYVFRIPEVVDIDSAMRASGKIFTELLPAGGTVEARHVFVPIQPIGKYQELRGNKKAPPNSLR